MLKYIAMIPLLLPVTVHAHDWDNDYWLERILRNHNKVMDCYQYAQDNARDDFKENCSPHVMGYTENDVFEEYTQQLAEHPTMDDINFLIDHFPPPPEMDAEEYAHIISEIHDNVYYHEGVNGIIMQMYIIDAIIRTDERIATK